MAFSYSSNNITLDGTILRANLSNKFGAQLPSALDLAQVLGNTDGVFVWGLTSFERLSRDIDLKDGHILTAQLQTSNGEWVNASYDLNTSVSNENGVLTAINVPAVIAVPSGAAIDTAASQLGKALEANPGWKVQVCEEPNGATLWYINAGAENKTDTFFKTYDANATAAFMHVVQDKGRAIERVNVDVFSANAGAKVEYIQIGDTAFGTYAGVNASLNLFKADASVFDLKLGVGLETGAGIQNGSIDVHVAGCGVQIGKRVAISVFGNEIGIDFGKFFD